MSEKHITLAKNAESAKESKKRVEDKVTLLLKQRHLTTEDAE